MIGTPTPPPLPLKGCNKYILITNQKIYLILVECIRKRVRGTNEDKQIDSSKAALFLRPSKLPKLIIRTLPRDGEHIKVLPSFSSQNMQSNNESKQCL